MTISLHTGIIMFTILYVGVTITIYFLGHGRTVPHHEDVTRAIEMTV